MRSRLMVPVLLVVSLAACADRATSPLAPAPATFGELPPPPFDAISTFSDGFQSSTFQAQYFLNKPGNNGFITFRNNESNTGFAATPNARISYHNGVVSGQGVLTFTQINGTSAFDLANVTAAVFNPHCGAGCGAFTVPGTFTASTGDNAGTAVPAQGQFFIGSQNIIIGGQ